MELLCTRGFSAHFSGPMAFSADIPASVNIPGRHTLDHGKRILIPGLPLSLGKSGDQQQSYFTSEDCLRCILAPFGASPWISGLELRTENSPKSRANSYRFCTLDFVATIEEHHNLTNKMQWDDLIPTIATGYCRTVWLVV